MSISIFKENGNIIGAFDDKKNFKIKTFHRILDTLINHGYFKTKKQCGTNIKEDLKLLYSETDYTFIYKDCKFEKITLILNEIEKIEIVRDQTENVFISYSLSTLNKPIEFLEVKDLYSSE